MQALKRALGSGGDRIRLHDLLKQELTSVANAPQVTATTFQGQGAEGYGHEVANLESTAAALLAVVAVAAYWGDERTDNWWFPSIGTFGERTGRSLAGGETPLIELTRYPAALLFEVGVTAAVASQRWGLVSRLDRLLLVDESTDVALPSAIALDTARILGGYLKSDGTSTGVEANDDLVAHVRELLRRIFTEHLLLTDADFLQASELAEYLLQISSYDWRTRQAEEPGRGPSEYAPSRYAGFHLSNAGPYNNTPRISATVRKFVADDHGEGPLQAGMFGGDSSRFIAAADKFDEDYSQQPPRPGRRGG